MYSQANVRAGKWLRPLVRALPSVIVVTEKVTRETLGPQKCDSIEESLLREERCSPWGAPRKPVSSPKNTCENVSIAMQGFPQRNLHQFIL